MTDPRAVRPVAHDAVPAVQLLALRDLGPCERARRQCERERHDEHPHDWWHVRLTIVAIPASRITMKKMTFDTSAADAKKCRRPCGGGSCSPTSRVARKTTTAASSAPTIRSSATAVM